MAMKINNITKLIFTKINNITKLFFTKISNKNHMYLTRVQDHQDLGRGAFSTHQWGCVRQNTFDQGAIARGVNVEGADPRGEMTQEARCWRRKR